MDLSPDEVRLLGKLFGTIGTPAAPDELESRIRICETASALYRKELIAARMNGEKHGG